MNKIFMMVAVSLLSVSANASLVSRLGGQAVYDTDRDITWLADANLPGSNSFGVSGITDSGTATDGQLSWFTAQSWIAAMNANNYLGVNNWRLPFTPQTDDTCAIQNQVQPQNQTFNYSEGLNCTGSELGHLFYSELGGTAGQPISTTHNANYDLFQNIGNHQMWSTEWTLSGCSLPCSTIDSSAWTSTFSSGSRIHTQKVSSLFAWAVRDGDISAVPLPGAAYLLGTGILGLAARARRRSVRR